MHSNEARQRRVMKKIKGLYRLLSDLSGSRWLIVIISALFPVLTIMVFGFFLAFKYGYILELSIAITVSTLLVTVPLFFLSRMAKQTESETTHQALPHIADGLVKTSSDWSQTELVIWNHSRAYTREQLKSGVDWENLHLAGFQILDLVADNFGKKNLEFSIPEGLKLFEEVSRRYKSVVKENIPGIEYIKISHIKAGYKAYEKYGVVGQKVVTAAIWANHAKNLYYNPLKVVSDLTKEQATSSMTKGFVDDIQLKAKEALLDEVAAVAIDLYSGRFSLEDEDLQVSSASGVDEGNFALPLEPIRIVTVGQTGTGKSSIVNLLTDELAAEVDVLPSTQTSTVYNALINDIEVRVVDLRGLDGDAGTEKQMLNEMTQADLILWVLKANQSARNLDKKLNDKLALFYADPKHISYKKPVVIAVVNQVDKLKPISQWQPPYDLENSDTAKAKIIVEAVAYNQELMNSDIALPLSISPTKTHFGVEALKQTLVDGIVEANNVQRNRQRVEAMKRGVSFKKQFEKTVNVGKKIVHRTLND